jgi:hypothetical protein
MFKEDRKEFRFGRSHPGDIEVGGTEDIAENRPANFMDQ